MRVVDVGRWPAAKRQTCAGRSNGFGSFFPVAGASHGHHPVSQVWQVLFRSDVDLSVLSDDSKSGRFFRVAGAWTLKGHFPVHPFLARPVFAFRAGFFRHGTAHRFHPVDNFSGFRRNSIVARHNDLPFFLLTRFHEQLKQTAGIAWHQLAVPGKRIFRVAISRAGC